MIPKLSELLKENIQFKKEDLGVSCRISVLGNVITHYIKDSLFNVLYKKGINSSINLGDYDTILQNTMDNSTDTDEVIIVFFELANFIDGLHYKLELYSSEEYSNILNSIKENIGVIFNNLKNRPLVLFNKFNAEVFNHGDLKSNVFIKMVRELSEFLEQNKPNNTHLVDIGTIYNRLSIESSINFRDFYSSKALYSTSFFYAYSELISPFILSLKGKSKKALIFDCDNTLWKGIIGEDGMEGIKMSSNQKMQPYEEVQYYAKYLASKGVIIGLCSKNNLEDVERVINEHPDFKLKEEEIVIKVVNWNDKASNLRMIAERLNIGLDSIVFVDDSDFEINLIKEQLPMVETIQVPLNELYRYPGLIKKAFSLFYNLNETDEDKEKVKMYRTNELRKQEQVQYTNLEDYLRSLCLNINVYVNDLSLIPRIAQMTQKTNQFNLTTKRYSDQEIENYIKSGSSVVAISVSDKFGDNGVTGLGIINYADDVANIDSLLMSCRILGRNIEYKFMDILFDCIKFKGFKRVNATYKSTQKNNQVSDFYDKLGFELKQMDENNKTYEINTNSIFGSNINYIKININD